MLSGGGSTKQIHDDEYRESLIASSKSHWYGINEILYLMVEIKFWLKRRRLQNGPSFSQSIRLPIVVVEDAQKFGTSVAVEDQNLPVLPWAMSIAIVVPRRGVFPRASYWLLEKTSTGLSSH